MREANDHGYWCIMLKDGTGATDYGNYQAAVKQIKMQGRYLGGYQIQRDSSSGNRPLKINMYHFLYYLSLYNLIFG